MKKFLPFENAAPSHDLFEAVFLIFPPRKFGELFISWAEPVQAEIPELAAIDGKTVRRSMNGAISPIHIVSARASEQNSVIGQIKTEEKSNEITAIPKLLSMLCLKKALVSIDAADGQKAIAEQVVLKKADYLLAVKQNQKTLYDDISLIFQDAESKTFPVKTEDITVVEKTMAGWKPVSTQSAMPLNFLPGGRSGRIFNVLGKYVRYGKQRKTSDKTRYLISSRNLIAQEFAKVEKILK